MADTNLPEGFYRICGYRVCGKRAVRVDMLERLSDLIRDRVFWKARIAEEARPAGSVEGGGFTIVSDMMSLVGCSGEEFEEILINLGFRAQKKQIAKPVAIIPPIVISTPPVEVETVSAEPAAPEIVPGEAASTETAPVPEMIEINVWWPKDTGPFRKAPVKAPRPPQAERQAERDAKPKFDRPRGTSQHNKDRKPKTPDRPPPRPPKPEKPMDPLSPFAKLAALKAQMQGN